MIVALSGGAHPAVDRDVVSVDEPADAQAAALAGAGGQAVVVASGDGAARLDAALRAMAPALQEHSRRLLEITYRINMGLGLDEVMDHVYDSFRPPEPRARSLAPVNSSKYSSC